MKAIMISLLLFFMQSQIARAFEDVIFYNEALDQQPEKCFYHLFNLFSRSIAHGLVVNGSRTGLGSENPTGKQMQADGLYFQLLNIISLVDFQFLHQLYQQDNGCLPRDIVLQAGAYPFTIIRTGTANDSELVGKINRALALLFPGIQQLQLLALPGSVLTPGTVESQSLQFAARDGIEDTLERINRINNAEIQIDLIERLQALLSAYTPLMNHVHLTLPDKPQTGSLKATILLPAFHQFITDDFEDPNTWHLQKGQPLTELPVPIKISLINITHVSYLTEADLSQAQVIQTQIEKRFDQPNKLSAVVTFGRLPNIEQDQALSIDNTFDEDALVLRLNLNSPPNPNDLPWVQGLKRQISLLTRNLTIDAHVHQLGIDFTRQAEDTNDVRFESAILRPHFSQKNSKLSFRLQQDTNLDFERNNLVALGFACEQGAQTQWHCERYYRTRKGLYSSTFGRTVGFLINSNIVNIEEALDAELSAVLDILLDRLATTTQTISQRLQR